MVMHLCVLVESMQVCLCVRAWGEAARTRATPRCVSPCTITCVCVGSDAYACVLICMHVCMHVCLYEHVVHTGIAMCVYPDRFRAYRWVHVYLAYTYMLYIRSDR
jgi:hypothetical protein